MNFDYISIKDLAQYNYSGDAYTCQLLCAFKTECKFWTFIRDGAQCKLKAALTTTLVTKVSYLLN